MTLIARSACCWLVAAFVAVAPEMAAAQTASPKIVINGGNLQAEIGLATGSKVEFSSNGDLTVQCRTSSGSCVTTNLGSGSSGSNPPTGVALTASPTSITTGSAVTLTRSSANAQGCYGVGATKDGANFTVSGWTGQLLPATGATSVTLGTAGAYVFQMYCFNATGASSTVSSAAVTVTQGTPNPEPGGDYCAEYYNGSTGPSMPTGAQFNAHGHERVEATFNSVWGVVPGSGSAVQRALPGTFLIPAQSRYLAIPFTMTANAGQTLMSMIWTDSSGLEGIITGSVTVTVSPCPGDFRTAVTGSNDIYLSTQCRRAFNTSGTLNVTSVTGQSGCMAPPGKQLYFNISTHNMYNATPGASSCGANSTCGVSMRP